MENEEMPQDYDYEFKALTDLVEICKTFEKRQMQMVDEIDDAAFCRIMKYLAERFPFIAELTSD